MYHILEGSKPVALARRVHTLKSELRLIPQFWPSGRPSSRPCLYRRIDEFAVASMEPHPTAPRANQRSGKLTIDVHVCDNQARNLQMKFEKFAVWSSRSPSEPGVGLRTCDDGEFPHIQRSFHVDTSLPCVPRSPVWFYHVKTTTSVRGGYQVRRTRGTL